MKVTYAVSRLDLNDRTSPLACATAELVKDHKGDTRLALVSRSGDKFFVDADALDAFFAAMEELKAEAYSA